MSSKKYAHHIARIEREYRQGLGVMPLFRAVLLVGAAMAIVAYVG